MPSLASMHLFSGVDAATVASVSSRCAFRKFAKGEAVFRQGGDAFKGLHFLLSGRLSLKKVSAFGKDYIFGDILPGGHYGEDAAITGDPQSSTAVASGISTIAILPAKFMPELMEVPAVARGLMIGMVQRLRLSQELLTRMATYDGETRVHFEMFRFASITGRVTEDGSYVTSDRVDQMEIAGRTGLSRETVNRILKALKKRSILSCNPDGATSVRPFDDGALQSFRRASPSLAFASVKVSA